MFNSTAIIQTLNSNSSQQYFTAILVLLIAMVVLWIFKTVIVGRLKKISKRTKNDFDDVIMKILSKLGWPIYFVIAIYFAFFLIAVPIVVSNALNIIALLVITFYAVLGINEGVRYGVKKIIKKRAADDDDSNDDSTAIEILGKVIRVLIWVVATLLVLSNLGYNISTLLAGFGIGGLAIAFALQKIFEDIFASFSIYFDKPFRRGDYIVIGADSGVVKHIGIKSTRVQTLQGEELIVSNTELTTVRVHNYKNMEERRIVFNIGVEYGTSNVKMKKINEIVKKAIIKAKLAKFDRVHFNAFLDSALNFEIVYHMKSSDYTKYLDTQQEINLEIKKEFEKAKIEMAFPTQTVFVKK